MQATVTLKGSTAEAMTLAFCADIAIGVLEGLQEEVEDRADFRDVGIGLFHRIEDHLGRHCGRDGYAAMIREIETATAELPPVRVRIGPVQMALPEEASKAEPGTTFDDAERLMEEVPEAERPGFDVAVGVDGWTMPTTWPEFGAAAVERLGYAAIGNVMGVLAEFGVDKLIANADYDLAFDPAEMWRVLWECAPPAELESDDPEGMTIKVEEIEGPDVADLAERMAEAGLDVMVIQGVTAETMDLDAAHAALVGQMTPVIEAFEEEAEAAEPEMISAFEVVDRVMTKADEAGGWEGEPARERDAELVARVEARVADHKRREVGDEPMETKVTAAEFTQVLDAEAVGQLRWLRARRGRVLHRWVDHGRTLCGAMVRSGIAPVEPGELGLPHCKGCERVTEETK